MPVRCKPFAHATLLWDRVEQAVAEGALGDDGPAFLLKMRQFAAGDFNAFGLVISEQRRFKLERAIRQAAHPDLTGRPRAKELFDTLSPYGRALYASDSKRGSPSISRTAEFLILEINRGEVPSLDYIIKVLTS